MSDLQTRTEAQDVPRTHSTVPTETPRREAVEDAQSVFCGRLYDPEYGNPVLDMLESPPAPVNTLLTGLEACPGCGEPMNYHDDEGFVL